MSAELSERDEFHINRLFSLCDKYPNTFVCRKIDGSLKVYSSTYNRRRSLVPNLTILLQTVIPDPVEIAELDLDKAPRQMITIHANITDSSQERSFHGYIDKDDTAKGIIVYPWETEEESLQDSFELVHILKRAQEGVELFAAYAILEPSLTLEAREDLLKKILPTQIRDELLLHDYEEEPNSYSDNDAAMTRMLREIGVGSADTDPLLEEEYQTIRSILEDITIVTLKPPIHLDE